MNLKEIQSEHGSVMLETLLVLPVCLMLIAAVFSVGEISLYRNLLLELDEYDTLRIGSRNQDSGSSSNIAQFLFRMPEGTSLKWNGFQYEGMEKQTPVISSNQWWQENRVWNRGSLTLPDWVRGIRYLNTRNGTDAKNKFVFYGSTGTKDVNGSAVYGMLSCSRKDSSQWRGGNRYQDAAELCNGNTPMWILIARENYCTDSVAGSSCSGSRMTEYARAGFDSTGNGRSRYYVFSGEEE